jgi:hypothetical protein
VAQPIHDPGGRVAFALDEGVDGSAEFSPCGRYRSILRRARGKDMPSFLESSPVMLGYALWIGLNPSVAAADVDDPTVRREWLYTERRLGLARYVKVNVFDYRATNPRRLLELDPSQRQSADNADLIVRLASSADVVVAAWGAPHNRLRPSAIDLHRRLAAADIDLKCVGLTAEGFPRHPLYVRSDATLISVRAPN